MIVDDVRYLIRQVIKNNDFAYRTYFVGGCVRDYVRGKDPHDIDVVVNIPNDCFSCCKRGKGDSHRTI